MEHWLVQKRNVAVEFLIRANLTMATQYGFQQQFHKQVAPARNTLLLWVSKWHEQGSVMDSREDILILSICLRM
jgi:hypothetical protein